jgi:hypothetical protein
MELNLHIIYADSKLMNFEDTLVQSLKFSIVSLYLDEILHTEDRHDIIREQRDEKYTKSHDVESEAYLRFFIGRGGVHLIVIYARIYTMK